MKTLLHLLIAITLALGASLASAQSYDCCVGPDCDMVQCIDMECAPAAAVVALTPGAAADLGIAARDYAPHAQVRPRLMVRDLWTPPD